jgi:dCTP deaminase
MILNQFQEISRSYLESEIKKLSELRTKEIPEYLKSVTKELIKDLREEFKRILDELDLKTFRSKLSVVEDINDLLSKISQSGTNNWVIPLIKECYFNSNISLINKEIIVVNSPKSEGFQVISDFLKYIESLHPAINFINHKRLDLFIVPYEVKFDLASVSIIGHEVGHVFLYEKYEDVNRIIKESFEKYVEKKAQRDIVLISEYYSKRDFISSHIQEYFCDEFGRFLLGPAFDFSLLKLFCYSYIEDQKHSPTHPPSKVRIDKAQKHLSEFELSHFDFSKETQELIKYFDGVTIDGHFPSEDDTLCQNIADELYSNFKLTTRLTTSFLNNTWGVVKEELDGFRPPFESFKNNRREIISPIQAVIASTLYYFGKTYTDSNDYFINSADTIEKKNLIVREKLIEHIQYAINLYDFVKHSNMRLIAQGFNYADLKNTLWNLRERTVAEKPSPFIIVPNIDPKVQYSSSSVDLRLGEFFLVNKLSKYTHIDPSGKPTTIGGVITTTPIDEYYDQYFVPVGNEFTLHPHQFILAQTLEYICIPADCFALVLGRSSWGRLGLNIATATAVGAGFRGCITLELRNLGETPLPLKVGVRICQISLIPISEIDSYKLYFTGQNKYVGPTTAEIPKIREDADWDLLDTFKK